MASKCRILGLRNTSRILKHFSAMSSSTQILTRNFLIRKANDIVARGHRALPYSIRDSDFANSLVRGVSNPYGQRKTSESEEIPGTKVF